VGLLPVDTVLINVHEHGEYSTANPRLYLTHELPKGGFAFQTALMGLHIGKITGIIFTGALSSQQQLISVLVQAIYNPLPAPYTGCLALNTNWVWQRYLAVLAVELRECYSCCRRSRAPVS
jgi:hypothetical protein